MARSTVPYSYHNFILTFAWKGATKQTANLDAFSRIFDRNPFWTQIVLPDENSFSDEEGHDAFLFYNEYQYFYPQVRSAIYGYDGIVKNYVFAQEHVHNKAHYYIEKNGTTYDLVLNQLRLRLYNTGIGLLCLECENHGKTKDGKRQDTFGDVKNINDYGRRINLPFLPDHEENGKAYKICADSLTLEIPGLGISWRTDFEQFGRALLASKERPHREFISEIKLNYLAGFIKELLSYGANYRFSSDSTEANGIYIHPVMDDRMFVTCIVNDPEATAEMIGNGSEPFPYERKPELNESIYEYIFIDNDRNCSCPHPTMRKELLEKHIYRRWLPYGTIYGICAHGLVLLNSGTFPPNVSHFLTQYTQMTYLCLMQLASLVVFQKETAELAVQIKKKKMKIKPTAITALMDLQERFSAFEGQFCFDFVSSEEQGIELYDMFREFFFIDKYREDVKTQMDGIRDSGNTYLEFNFNKIGYSFTFIGAILAIAQVYYSVPSPQSPGILENPLVHSLFWIVLCVITFLAIRFIYRRRKKK